MQKMLNPFVPNSIVKPAMLAGRIDEIRIIEGILSQVKAGNPENFLIFGEPGIGKTSLLHYISALGRGDIQQAGGERFRFVVARIQLESHDDYGNIAIRIASGVEKALSQVQRARTVLKEVWEFLSRWKIMGVEYSRKGDSGETDLVDNFVTALSSTVEQFSREFRGVDGILILIDEAHRPSSDARLGDLLRYIQGQLAASLQVADCENNVSMGAAGESTVLHKLGEANLSAPRMFRPVHLKHLDTDESVDAIRRALSRARESNKVPIEISVSAAEWIARLSGGHPYFLQAIGKEAFSVNDDNLIDDADVQKGAFGPGRALDQIGTVFFAPRLRSIAGNSMCMKLLGALVEHQNLEIGEEELLAAFGRDRRRAGAGLRQLEDVYLAVTMNKAGEGRLVRLQSEALRVWLKERSP